MSLASVAAVLCVLACVCVGQNGGPVTIPLPFGSFTIGKGKDGNVDVGVNNGLNILGWGAKRNTTFTVGDGTFVVKDNAGAIVNGTDVGGGGAVGFANNTVIADADVKLKNQTIQGGLGKEANFFEQLFGTIKAGKKQQ